MFTFFIELLDLIFLKQLGVFFTFFLATWVFFLIKRYNSLKYLKEIEALKMVGNYRPAVSVILPIVDEPIEVWEKVLESLKVALQGLKHEVIVVFNGKNGEVNKRLARNYGYNVYSLPTPNKREAIAFGVEKAKHDITIMLDSDTICTPTAITELISMFQFDTIGGIVPRQEVFNRDDNLLRKFCDWLEHLRFLNGLPGTANHGAVPCLIGRLYAIRTSILKDCMPEFLNETFLGYKCVIGDDRFITSCILKRGYHTVYQPRSLVYTDAPNTIKQFMKQRTRWARSSFRETIMAIPWIFKHKYTAFVLFGDIFMLWFLFFVLARFLFGLVAGFDNQHYISTIYPELNNVLFFAIGSMLGFIVSSFTKQMHYFKVKPKDFWYAPLFMLFLTFCLVPTQWIGHLTCWKNGWMTRKVD